MRQIRKGGTSRNAPPAETAAEGETELRDRLDVARWLRDLLCGALIGAGAILPGVSGGVLAVVFGIYQPFMEALTHPLRTLPLYWKWIPPLAIGWAVGFLGFARGISVMLNFSAAVTTWLFIGLIVGTFPSLLREARREGAERGCRTAFFACFAAMFGGLFYVSRVAAVHVEPNFWWYSFCGALWGMGIVIPGMTSSSILMALDLYQPLMDGLSRLDIPVLAATLPGMAAALAALSHLVAWLFRRHYSLAFHGILGIVAASTLVIVPTAYSGTWEAVLSGIFCVAGFLLAYFLSRLDRKIQEK
jgi:Predicted membrane protein